MTATKEYAAWAKGKTPIIDEYRKERRTIHSAVAGRGFESAPGFMYDFSNDLEIMTKLKLSELNYNIIAEAIEEELKQAGFDYDLAYKNALMAWELEKAELLSNLERELALLKQTMAFEDENIKILAQQLTLRAIELIEAKTAIELEIEGYRLLIAQLGAETAPYEVALAEAKVLTANKKLEIIPILQEILALEQDMVSKIYELLAVNQALAAKNIELVEGERDILAAEEALLTKMDIIINKTEDLNEKIQEILDAEEDKESELTTLIDAQNDSIIYRISLMTPAITALIAILGSYKTAIETQTGIYEDIYDVKEETLDLEEAKLTKYSAIIEKQREITETTLKLIEATGALVDYQIGKLAPAISELITIYNAYAEALEDQLELEEDIIDVKMQIVELGRDEVDRKLDISAKEVELETLKQNLITLRTDTAVAKAALNLQLVQIDAQKAQEVMDAEIADTAELLQAEQDSANTIETLKLDSAAIQRAIQLLSVQTITDSAIDASERVSGWTNQAIRGKADLDAAAVITSKLTHLLSQ